MKDKIIFVDYNSPKAEETLHKLFPNEDPRRYKALLQEAKMAKGISVDFDGEPSGVIISSMEDPYFSSIFSHELDHATHNPYAAPEGFLLDDIYFKIKNGTELSARGSQIKDYFKITDPHTLITLEMLKYAAQNYVRDTGQNNLMTPFFNSIVDYTKAATWLSKYASGFVPFLLYRHNDNTSKDHEN